MPKATLHIPTLHDLITYLETRKAFIERQRNGRKFNWDSGAVYGLEEVLEAIHAFKATQERETLEKAKALTASATKG